MRLPYSLNTHFALQINPSSFWPVLLSLFCFVFLICLFLRLTCGGTLNPNIRTACRLRIFIIPLKLNRGVSCMDTYGYLSNSCHASVQPLAILCMIIKIKLCFLLLHSWSSRWSGLVEKTLTSQSMTFTFQVTPVKIEVGMSLPVCVHFRKYSPVVDSESFFLIKIILYWQISAMTLFFLVWC